MESKCNTCFYKEFDKQKDFPCKACENFNSYVNYMTYQQPDALTIRAWDEQDAFVEVHKPDDKINSPKHYTAGKFEVIDVIEDWELNFRLANTVKYIARHQHKGKPLEDLKKAQWYLQREIDKWSSLLKN